jgi:hypothetical protein
MCISAAGTTTDITGITTFMAVATPVGQAAATAEDPLMAVAPLAEEAAMPVAAVAVAVGTADSARSTGM